jgi:hypothetical protein
VAIVELQKRIAEGEGRLKQQQVCVKGDGQQGWGNEFAGGAENLLTLGPFSGGWPQAGINTPTAPLSCTYAEPNLPALA